MRGGLAFRINLIILAAVLALGGVLAALLVPEQRRVLGAELDRRVEAFGGRLAHSLGEHAGRNDPEAYERLLEAAVLDREITYLLVRSPAGEVLAARWKRQTRNGTREYAFEVAMPPPGNPPAAFGEVVPGPRGAVTGVLAVGVDLSTLNGAVRSLYLRSTAYVLIAGALAMLVGSLATGAMLRRSLDPLVAGIRSVEADDLGPRFRDGQSGEFGEIGRAFNHMLDRLARAMVSKEALEETVAARTAELRDAKRELERRNEELRKLDVIKDGLVRDVTHELKTPVAKLAMQLEILKALLGTRGLLAEAAPHLRIIESALARQDLNIRNILDLSRLEGGARQYRREAMRLDELLAAVIADYREVMASCAVECRDSLEEVAVDSDRDMLWLAFSNVLGNAIKFRTRGAAARVDVTLRREGGRAVVRIADNGIGLTPGQRARVFERFYQVSPSVEGSGVGMAIVRMIVTGLGGTVEIDSPGPGLGTTVEIVLPQGPAPA